MGIKPLHFHDLGNKIKLFGSGRGGTGRRGGFKIRWPYGRPGSTPGARTTFCDILKLNLVSLQHSLQKIAFGISLYKV